MLNLSLGVRYPYAMHPNRLILEAPRTHTRRAGTLLIVLLAVLLGNSALADGDGLGALAADHAVTEAVSMATEAWRGGEPSCHHGHDKLTLSQGMARNDRQQVENGNAISVATVETFPLILGLDLNIPRHPPSLPSVALYLLTQRIRL